MCSFSRDAVRIVDYFEEVTRHRDTFKCRFRFMKYSKKCTYKENIPRQRSEVGITKHHSTTILLLSPCNV